MARRLAQLAALAVLTSASTIAAATPLSEAVGSAAFELCPALLTGEVSVSDASAMKKLGFVSSAPDPGKEIHPRFGKLQMIVRKVSNVDLTVVSGENAFCQIQWEKADGPDILAMLKSEVISEHGYVEDANNRGIKNGVSFETFTRKLEPGIVSYFQLLTMPQPSGKPRLMAQFGVMEE